jgi:hypothetical protein
VFLGDWRHRLVTGGRRLFLAASFRGRGEPRCRAHRARWIEDGGGSAELRIPGAGGLSHRGRRWQRGPGTAAAESTGVGGVHERRVERSGGDIDPN